MAYIAVGKSLGQAAGPLKTTGDARYTGDIRLPGLLWGKIVRSPYPHARIVSIDTSAALAMPGVRAVLTGADIPDSRVGRALRDVPVLARDKVIFVGDKVAAVAADDLETANAAALAIEVEYEELDAVFDIESAMAEGAPIIHPGLAEYKGIPGPPPNIPNVITKRSFERGDLDAGFATADFIVEGNYSTPRQHQVYLETHSSVVKANEDGTMETWSSNKTPYLARKQLSLVLGIPEEKIIFHIIPVGADFGGKGSTMDQPIGYYLSKATGRPVRFVMTYIEELTAGNPRHASSIWLKTGVKKDGTLVAHEARIYFDSGAYGGFKPSPLVDLNGGFKVGGPYKTENVKIDSYMVYTNQVPSGHMRSPGLPQAVFALESHLDVVARKIGMDPLELRLKNVVHDGDTAAGGEKWVGIKATQTLNRAADSAGWSTPKQPNQGRGIAMGEHPAGGGEATVEVGLDDAGFYMRTAAPDTGTGNHTIMRQVVAEDLGVPAEEVRILVPDTNNFPVDGGVGGSRVTHVHGQAANRAANGLKELLVAQAAVESGKQVEELKWEGGRIVDGSGNTVPYADVPADQRSAIITHNGGKALPYTGFCAQVVDVNVDVETGQIKINNIVTAHDVGTIINPNAHQGQIDGGVIQALGYATMEELVIADGRVVTQSLGDYKAPTMGDIPPLRTELVVNEPEGPAPFEAKAIGETPNTPLAAAVANAVEDAVGVRIADLPVTAEKIFRALRAKASA